jgi:tRNA modification GTPase
MPGALSARRRHLDALERARRHAEAGRRRLVEDGAGELLAEELRIAQEALGEITGAVTSEALLDRIFASFCIGK